ncbi:glycosyltransferase family 4 protein [Infirmifilum sp. NZ]|uniref:glycosyltransferase family 4 protein n=1 Tax=Infirmifilum sp. NZ TaxID=2926850 RepID=UPI0027A1B8F6|nr:glycosyltransferase family 4 protein [Infirmifilum sp. NZ]UNQ73153.1 glycosyltransferase family 4 protein [Infirmifilum sp. NZ]
MRIIYIGPMDIPIPSEKGAVEEIIWQLSLKLSSNGFKVSIYNPIASNTLSKVFKSIVLHGIDCDNCILHFHDLIACGSYSSIIRYSYKSILLSLHYPPWFARSSFRHLALRFLLKYLKSRQTIFVAPSRVITNWIKRRIGGTAVFIPNGVDTSIFNPVKRSLEVREKMIKGKDVDVLVCYVARVHPSKNQLDLLKAARILVSSGIKNFRLIFIGPLHGRFGKQGGEFKYFESLRQYIEKHNLEKFVEFLGEIPHHDDVASYMASCDIYVHPSIIEAAAPLAILEALASGLPVVAYNLVYYLDYLKNHENAILVDKGDVKALAGALESLITQPILRKHLGENGRRFAERELSWENIVKKYYIPLYNKLEQNTYSSDHG